MTVISAFAPTRTDDEDTKNVVGWETSTRGLPQMLACGEKFWDRMDLVT